MILRNSWNEARRVRFVGFWTPQRDVVDPTIRYLPLEDPAPPPVTVSRRRIMLIA